jgi:hypothetical protein
MLLAYRRERLPVRLIAPLSAGLALASAPAARAFTGLTLLQDAGLMALMLAQFRLWDDLADRARDADAHPDRVLVRAAIAQLRSGGAPQASPPSLRARGRRFAPASLRPSLATATPHFAVGLAAILAASVLALVYPHTAGALLFLVVNALAAAWYAQRGSRSTLGDHIVLAKYPAFVTVVALARGIDRPLFLLASATAVYFAACVYEVVHDPAAPAGRHRTLVACESALLVVASAAAAIGALL